MPVGKLLSNSLLPEHEDEIVLRGEAMVRVAGCLFQNGCER